MTVRHGQAVRDEVLEAAAVAYAHGLVGAFGHVSGRISNNEVVVTRPAPLGQLRDGTDLLTLDIREPQSTPGLPGEVWIHVGIYRSRADVQGICRVQPKSVTALAALGVQAQPLHVLGAMVGPTNMYPSATLVRSEGAGEEVARALELADALALKGNGVVTVGRSIGSAVALAAAWEESAELNLLALRAGNVDAMTQEDAENLFRLRDEVLGRYWRYLSEEYVPRGQDAAGQKGAPHGSQFP